MSRRRKPVPPPPPPPPPPAPAPSGFLGRSGGQLTLNGQPWTLRQAAIYGTLTNPGIGPITDMALAGALNAVRPTNYLDQGIGVSETLTKGYPSGAADTFSQESRWRVIDQLLAACKAKGLKVDLDLSCYGNWLNRINGNNDIYNYFALDWGPFISFIVNRANTLNGLRYGDDPTIAFWSISGEPQAPAYGTNKMGVTTAQQVAFYKRTASQIRTLDANHLISTGGFSYLDNGDGLGSGSGIAWKTIMRDPNIGLYALHNYSDNDQLLATPAVSVEASSQGKPWITEEFGFTQGVGGTPTYPNGVQDATSDRARAARIANVYAKAKGLGTAGSGVWNLKALLGANHYDIDPVGTPLTFAAVKAQ